MPSLRLALHLKLSEVPRLYFYIRLCIQLQHMHSGVFRISVTGQKRESQKQVSTAAPTGPGRGLGLWPQKLKTQRRPTETSRYAK